MADETTEESIDQPFEESDDQPEVESEESTNSDEETTYESEDEVEQPKVDSIDINGERISLDELKNGYLRKQDYTKKTQELAEMRRQMAVPPPIKKEISQQEQEALTALDKLGVAKKSDIDEAIYRALARNRMIAERQAVQQAHNLPDAVMNAVQSYALSNNVSMAEALESIKAQFSPKEPVKMKAVGAKGGAPTSVSSRQSSKITPQSISNMDPNSKEFERVVEMMEKGEL